MNDDWASGFRAAFLGQGVVVAALIGLGYATPVSSIVGTVTTFLILLAIGSVLKWSR